MAYKEKANAIKYNNEYIKQAYDRINLTVPKGKKEIIQSHAESIGLSTNSFINRAIDSALQSESGAGSFGFSGGELYTCRDSDFTSHAHEISDFLLEGETVNEFIETSVQKEIKHRQAERAVNGSDNETVDGENTSE